MSGVTTKDPELTSEKPKRENTFITEPIRRGIIADVASGMKHKDVALKWDVHYNTVTRVIKSVAPGSSLDRKAIREEIIDDSYQAIRRGLKTIADPVQRADLGVKSLKGLGEFESGNNLQVNVMLQQLNQLPPDMAERYVTLDPLSTSSETPTE